MATDSEYEEVEVGFYNRDIDQPKKPRICIKDHWTYTCPGCKYCTTVS